MKLQIPESCMCPLEKSKNILRPSWKNQRKSLSIILFVSNQHPNRRSPLHGGRLSSRADCFLSEGARNVAPVPVFSLSICSERTHVQHNAKHSFDCYYRSVPPGVQVYTSAFIRLKTHPCNPHNFLIGLL